MCGGRATDSTVKAYYVRFAETCKRWTSSLLMRTCHHSLFDPNNKPATLSQPLHDDHESDMHMIATSWLSVSPSTSLNDTCRTYVSRTVPPLERFRHSRAFYFGASTSLTETDIPLFNSTNLPSSKNSVLIISWIIYYQSLCGHAPTASHIAPTSTTTKTCHLLPSSNANKPHRPLQSFVRRLVAGQGEGVDE